MANALYVLAGLLDADIDWMAGVGTLRRLDAGTRLIEAGFRPAELYFVLGGTLDVRLGDGKSVAMLGSGDLVGEMSFVEQRAPGASVVAATAAELLAVPAERILAQLEEDQGFGLRFYRALAALLSERLRATTAGTAPALDEAGVAQVEQAGAKFERLARLTREPEPPNLIITQA